MQINEYFDTTPPLLIQFLMYSQTVKSHSKLTVIEYMFDLRMFLRYMKLYGSGGKIDDEEINKTDITDINIDFIKNITKEDIYTFLFYASQDRENEMAARARKLSSIKSFFKYLNVKANLIDVNPAENIDAPRIKQNLPKYLSLDESILLLKTVKEDDKNKNRLRDYCIVTMFLNCGLRLSELVGIDLTDISTDFKSVRIFGKGNKERFIYLNDATKEAMLEYIEGERSKIENIIDKNALFISSTKRTRINKSTVQKMTEKYFNLAGFADRDFSTHKLRHTAATLMHQYGNVDVRVLQEILGHEQLNTTQIYTHINNSQLQKAVDSNPLAKVKSKKGND